jgi:hypothetical protein
MKRVAGLVLALLCLGAGDSLAQGPSPAEVAGSLGIAEVRAGAMIDEVELYDAAPHIVPRPDTISLGNLSTVSFDVLFRSPDIAAFRWLGSPRPTVGFDYDFRHESMAHLSLNWHIPLGSSRFYVEPELGGAIHNGALTGAVAPARTSAIPRLAATSAGEGPCARLPPALSQRRARTKPATRFMLVPCRLPDKRASQYLSIAQNPKRAPAIL